MGIFDWFMFLDVPKQLRGAMRIINKLNPEWKVDLKSPDSGIIFSKETDEYLVRGKIDESYSGGGTNFDFAFEKSMILIIEILSKGESNEKHNWINLVYIREYLLSGQTGCAPNSSETPAARYLVNFRNNTKTWKEKIAEEKIDRKATEQKKKKEKREKEEKRKKFLRTLNED